MLLNWGDLKRGFCTKGQYIVWIGRRFNFTNVPILYMIGRSSQAWLRTSFPKAAAYGRFASPHRERTVHGLCDFLTLIAFETSALAYRKILNHKVNYHQTLSCKSCVLSKFQQTLRSLSIESVRLGRHHVFWLSCRRYSLPRTSSVEDGPQLSESLWRAR